MKKPLLNIPGQRYCDFEVTKVLDIPELQCYLRELIHLPSGAQVMHLANNDPENLFCLSFRTIPYNSNGVAHILEHVVLCGSEKFPVKDPFFSMHRRSLNTYMNALTGADFTCYPAASQVPQDFYNLLDVYLDAVFKPKLNELSFLQEGHRLEFAVIDDPSSPLQYKGVVYNEMKGALSSPNARIAEEINHALFPDLTYGYNSGGDPRVIPSLTYEELIDFHRQYYHPSRCLFFFYGNMPLHDHLDFISTHALKNIEYVPPIFSIPLQPRFTSPKFIESRYPASPQEDKTNHVMIAFAWLTCHILEQQEVLALNILEIILLDTDASPLKMALLKSGFCKQVIAFMEAECSEIPFAIILKGCSVEHAEALKEIIVNTLKEIVKNGIPLESIENAMHQLEFHRSEITGDHVPFGLSLFMRAALLKQHGANPEDGLKIHSLFEKLRKLFIEEPSYLIGLISKHLLDNSHFVQIVMKPDHHLESEELAEERIGLEKKQASLDETECKTIIKKSKDLLHFQESQKEENLDLLPSISLKDIPKYAKDYELIEEKINHMHLFSHHCFTNEIVYADLTFELPNLLEEDLPLLRLFTVLLSQVGCGERDYIENLDYIQANTGGIGVALMINSQAHDPHLYSPSFCIRGKSLYRKAKKLFLLFKDMVSNPDFTDISRLKEVILKHYTALQTGLNQNALKYAINISSSCLSIPAKISSTWYGLDYFWKIKEIALNFDDYANNLVEKMQHFQDQILCLDHPHLILTCDASMYNELKGHEFYGLPFLENKPFISWKGDYALPSIEPQGRIISSPVSFIAKVFQTVSYTHPHSPALNVAAFLFDNLILHTRLREQGGAYGGGAVCNAMGGTFYFYSYRDPHICNTFQAFDESVEEVLQGHFNDSDLEEAKIEMIQGMDSPVAPGSRGDLAYGWYRVGKTLPLRQAYRDKLLALTRHEVVEAVREEILPRLKDAIPVVFSNKELLEKENTMLIAQGKKPLAIQTI